MNTTTVKVISLFSILNHFVSDLFEHYKSVTDLGCSNDGFCNSSTYRGKRTRERERGEITREGFKTIHLIVKC